MTLKIVAGTGHRPFQGKFYPKDQEHRLYHTLTNDLYELAKDWLLQEKPDKVISGMALGWDQALASASISLDIPLICAVPFKGQESMWPSNSKKVYHYLLSKASEVVIVCEGGYSPDKMQIRNEWMVDQATEILAMWDGSTGGTRNCISYAQSKGKKITNLWYKWVNNVS